MRLELAPVENNFIRTNWTAILKSTMSRIRCKCHKVPWSIIICDAIDMVNMFLRFKKPAKLFFDNQSMLGHISCICTFFSNDAIRMMRGKKVYVPIFVLSDTAFPGRIIVSKIHAFFSKTHLFSLIGWYDSSFQWMRFSFFPKFLIALKLGLSDFFSCLSGMSLTFHGSNATFFVIFKCGPSHFLLNFWRSFICSYFHNVNIISCFYYNCNNSMLLELNTLQGGKNATLTFRG